MAGVSYTSTVERAGPRRRLWYWQVDRDGRQLSAGYAKTEADAEQYAADSLTWHEAADSTFGIDRLDQPRAGVDRR